MHTNKYKIKLTNDNLRSSILSNVGILNYVHYVDSNPVKIETIETAKENSKIKQIKKQQSFNLKNFKIKISKNDNLNFKTENITPDILNEIISIVNISFIESLNSNIKSEIIKYFQRGFIKNLFTKKDPKVILSNIENCNWIITSDKILKELSKIKNFDNVNNTYNKSNFKLCGRIDNIHIYTSDLINDTDIYIGYMDSISAIFNKNIELTCYDDKLEILVEYLFINKLIKKLIVL